MMPNRKHSYPFLTFYFRFCKRDVFRELGSSKTSKRIDQKQL